MQEILGKIRWNITFITEEIFRVNGSDDVKKEIAVVCNDISDVLNKIEASNEEESVSDIKGYLNKFDEIIDRIENDTESETLYMLLITHVADMKFLFLTDEEKNNLLKSD
jgi:nitrate/nitrite-specific signal transduction histidine kinase